MFVRPWALGKSHVFRFADEFGPTRIFHIHRHSVGLKAIVVVDNTACGAAIGGVRMAPDVSVEECFRLARTMTWKNAAVGLPHGGGKSVIFGDPGMTPAAREELVQDIKAVTVPHLTLADVKGRSIMIHVGGDNYSDQPAPLGGGGARIACGVVK
jgi:hypothetical protein